MTILDTIVEHKRIEVLKRKRKFSVQDFEGMEMYGRIPLKINPEAYKEKPGIIAEFKRRSPSKGIINADVDPVNISKAYSEAGVAAMSILTDRDFFGGSFQDLSRVRKKNPGLHLLRKDFIIDPYQVHEAKAYGADIILLIAAILKPSEISDLSLLAKELGLQVLFEVHNRKELDTYVEGIDLVGVNNRDLKNFTVDINNSLALIGHFPDGVIPVSESGISGHSEIKLLFEHGFKLFLIGESFMKDADPGEACKTFIQQI